MVPLAWVLFLQEPFGWNGVVFLGLSAPFWLIVLIIGSGVSDIADGVIARRMHSMSAVGKIMDPVADKFFITTCWIFLMYVGRLHPVWVILAIGRDVFISALRNLAGAEGKVISASASAKTKTVIQFVSAAFLVHGDVFGWLPWIPLLLVGQILFYVALALSYYSLTTYFIDYFRPAVK